MTTMLHVKEISIPIGAREIRISVPLSAQDPSERLSFWWGLTSASIVLARHIEALEQVDGQSVVELGCGLGLPGIVAAQLGAKVTFTDYVPDALEAAQHNARLNELSAEQTSFRIWDWETCDQHGAFKLIIGSELLYDYFFHGSLAQLLERILEPEGKIILTDRPRLCVQRFLGRMVQKGFTCTETRNKATLEGFPDQEISIFTLQKTKGVSGKD